MKGRVIIIFVFLSFLFLHSTGIEIVQSEEAQWLPSAQGGECKVCHVTDGKLPEGHMDTALMDLKKCLECHGEDTPMLVNTLPLSHIHILSGVSCAACHGDVDPPQGVESNQCLSCHKPDFLIIATEGHKEANPHDSHYGPELDCNLCHHAHTVSENYCNQCHEFNFVIPSPIAKHSKKIVGDPSDNEKRKQRVAPNLLK